MSTFATNANNDIFLDENGSIAIVHDKDHVAKELCQNKLQTFLNEIFTDPTLGTDWFGTLLSDANTLEDKINEFNRVIYQVPYVKEVTAVRYKQDKISRVLTFEIDILTENGTITLQDLKVGL